MRLTIDMIKPLDDGQCPVFRLDANILCKRESFTSAVGGREGAN